MLERLSQFEQDTLPPIKAGEIIRKTPNFQVVTDYKPGLEGKRKGERFFIEPLTPSGTQMLLSASQAHNVYNFNHRTVGEYVFPCLRADYIKENLPVLLKGEVQIPKPGEDTIPSPDRMDELIAQHKHIYTFADNLPEEFGITNRCTRKLRIFQMSDKDAISSKSVHSYSYDSYYKVRKKLVVRSID